MDSVSVSISEFNIYLNHTFETGVRLLNSRNCVSNESLYSTTSVSNEGIIDWVKDKISKIGRRFVIIVNKLVARFSKNREQLEADIAKYKADPTADVKLAVSPRTLKKAVVLTAMIAGAIVAMFLCIPRKDGKSRIGAIFGSTKEKVNEVKSDIKKDKAEGPHVVKAGAVATEVTKTVTEVKKTEATLKQAESKIAQAGSGADEGTVKEKLSSVAAAASHSLELAKDSAAIQSEASKAHVASDNKSSEAKAEDNKSSSDKPAEKSDSKNKDNHVNEISGILSSLLEKLRKDYNVPSKYDGKPGVDTVTANIRFQRNRIYNNAEHEIKELFEDKDLGEASVAKAKSIADKALKEMSVVHNNEIQKLNSPKFLKEQKEAEKKEANRGKTEAKESSNAPKSRVYSATEDAGKLRRLINSHHYKRQLTLRDDERNIPACGKASDGAIKSYEQLVKQAEGAITKVEQSKGDKSGAIARIEKTFEAEFDKLLKGFNDKMRRIKKSSGN